MQALYARIVRDLVRLLTQPTADGHVLRVDLRLRPEPSARSVAVSVPAALAYYETFGQNWERAALIKARPCAGDLVLGAEVLSTLAPFVWRKYLDLAAIADIHAMKRQIHAAKGGGEIAVAGHDVKLGRGGIRDIEFFVQTQQLIFGGRRPALRGNRTVAMLHRLRLETRISRHAEDDLEKAYVFLRSIEHRLQMQGDQQTHKVPQGKEALERFARFCGYETAATFSAAFERYCRLVAHHYALLFENAPKLGHASGDLVFTGISDDPGTLRTLEKLGFRDPGAVAATVRAWHAGLRPAVRSPRAREKLTELVPPLLASFARGSDPDAAVAGFDRALERLPTATELFAILTASAALRTLFGEILGGAPAARRGGRAAPAPPRHRHRRRRRDHRRRGRDGDPRSRRARAREGDRRGARPRARLPARGALSHRHAAARGRIVAARGRARLHHAPPSARSARCWFAPRLPSPPTTGASMGSASPCSASAGSARAR